MLFFLKRQRRKKARAKTWFEQLRNSFDREIALPLHCRNMFSSSMYLSGTAFISLINFTNEQLDNDIILISRSHSSPLLIPESLPRAEALIRQSEHDCCVPCTLSVQPILLRDAARYVRRTIHGRVSQFIVSFKCRLSVYEESTVSHNHRFYHTFESMWNFGHTPSTLPAPGS